MTALVNTTDDHLTTTSKIISDAFGKVHRVVLKAIDELECSEGFRKHNFMLSYYMSPQNKKIKCYRITEEGFYFLCMGFTGKRAAKWKESFITEFKRMRLGTLNIDSRMIEISKKLEAVKADGKLWSQIGHEIRKNKKIACDESIKLLNEVQLKLDY
jgi:Rha family phage regulatory protein